MADAIAPVLLVAGGDSKRLQWIIHHITSQWPESVIATVPSENSSGLNALIKDSDPDAVLLHVDFTREDDVAGALDCILQTLRLHPQMHFIILANDGSELGAVRMLKAGARDYIPMGQINRELLLGAVAESTVRRTRAMSAASAAAASISAPSSATIDIEVPGYEILKNIAVSNFSAVYLARSRKLQRNVVLKVLSREPSIRESHDEERFQREYEIISSIQHPAIVGIHDFGTLPRHLYLAMEYFPCGDLRDRLRNPLSPAESLYYLRAIAEALRVIHVFGILHRDLKPGNVMLREDNSPVLIDFGLARRAEDDGNATGIGKIMGSPYYMSPEQTQGHRVDIRSDIYSLGVMFHEMLTGSRPYLGRSALSIMAQHVKSPIPVLPVDLSHLQPLLNRLMAKDLNARYASADHVLADLPDLVPRSAVA